MASIITSKFRSDSIRFFLNDLENNDYYVFGSSTNRSTAVNSLVSTTDFLERTIFGKKVDLETNFFFMIKNYPWQSELVYDQYDDAVDLSDKRYYAVVYSDNNDTGDFRVYKCLFNNYGSPSRFPPSADEGSGDGYIWKLMYIISETDFDEYNTLGYIPITANTLIANTSFDTSVVEEIIVENNLENNGYEKFEGSVFQVNTTTVLGTDFFDTIVLKAGNGYSFSEISNYYANRLFYANNTQTGISSYYTISSYTFDTETGNGIIRLSGSPAVDGVILPGDGITTFEILPQIEVTGDGTGAFAKANVVDGKIASVSVVDAGSGYTNVSARVLDPFGFAPTDENRLDVRATLRPILSPRGGHTSNLVDELSCRHCMIYVEITELDNITIPITNAFSKIGLVKNPLFTSNTIIFDNRIEIEIADTSSLTVNEQITQVNTSNEIAFSSRLHEISANTNTIYLSDYHGPYQNAANTNFSIDPNLFLTDSQGNLLEINTITYPLYEPKTGDVYYMNDFFPIERNSSSRELFKIIIEF